MTTRHGLEIRAADAVDAPGLAELLGGSAAAVGARLERMRAERATVLLAVEWGPPSGLIVLHARQGLLADRPQGVVSALLVAPEARRRGIGRLLLKAASQAARMAGCGELVLAAPLEAEGLAEFCQATGFSPVETGFSRPLRKGG